MDVLGFLDQAFLICGEDGVVRVKDGRSLEEYINDPRLVKRRKKTAKYLPRDMVLGAKDVYDAGVLARHICA